MNKVLVTGSSVARRFLDELEAAGLEVHNPTHLLSEEELSRELSDAAAYLLGGDEVATDAALSGAKSLRHIAFLGVGYESFIDVAAADRLGIVVTNTPGTLTAAVAEFTIGQLINANRRLTQYTNAYRDGRRDTEEKQRDLVARRVGIIGLGVIGTRIAEILRTGFGVRVSYYSRTRKPHEESRLGIAYLDLPDLAAASDVLIVMTPGNESTWNLVDAAVLSRLPEGAVLVNTARYGVVEGDALHQALQDGSVSVAVFDGFYEGETGDRLLSAFGEDRLLVTNHIASLTHDARDGMSVKAVQSILSVRATGTDEYAVGRAGRR